MQLEFLPLLSSNFSPLPFQKSVFFCDYHSKIVLCKTVSNFLNSYLIQPHFQTSSPSFVCFSHIFSLVQALCTFGLQVCYSFPLLRIFTPPLSPRSLHLSFKSSLKCHFLEVTSQAFLTLKTGLVPSIICSHSTLIFLLQTFSHLKLFDHQNLVCYVLFIFTMYLVPFTSSGFSCSPGTWYVSSNYLCSVKEKSFFLYLAHSLFLALCL